MKLGVFMLWTEMREVPKELVPLAFDQAIREHDRAAALSGRAYSDDAPSVGAADGSNRKSVRKKHRASVIVDESTSV